MNHLKDITVLVLGLGDSGLAMARWCAGHGAQVRVWDSREEPPQAATLAAEVPSAQRWRGALDAEALIGVQLLLKSPGLAPNDERIAPLLAIAKQTGVAVQGELDLFARALADLKTERGYAPKVIAITGTNGKTTTTSMTALLVERTGLRTSVAGNIGPTMLQTLADALAKEPVKEVEVEVPVEPEAEAPVLAAEPEAAPATDAEAAAATVASMAVDILDAIPFTAGCEAPAEPQAEVAAEETASDEAEIEPEAPAPEVAAASEPATDGDDPLQGGGPPPHLIPPPPPGPVFDVLPEVWVLELSSFQLDGVQGFEPGAATVLNVTQDHLDWHGSMEAYAAAKARIFGAQAVMVVNRDEPTGEAMVAAAQPPKPASKGFGKGKPPKAVERHVVRFGLNPPTRPGDFGLVVENGMAWLVRAMESDETIKRKRGEVDEDLVIQRLMPADALRVRGRHNASNALAALALATAVGCPLAPMLHGLREYAGEPHRVEFVAVVNGVEAYDDSKGTNVGATVAALNGLGDSKSPSKLVVILGGDGKGQDFSPLLDPVRKHVRAVATIGRDAPAVESALQGSGVALERHDTLPAAVRWCFERAHAGDAVLLSPACASLDMFRNYAHRAEVFVSEVHALVEESGGVQA
jgi:UDP-N-acetylmuramoylalanine--D-glutamate ligase